MNRYFGGVPANMGRVSALPFPAFSQLCDDVVDHPVKLGCTREEYHAFDKKDQDKIKQVRYLVPATFKESPSPRKYEHATHCNLLFLDVDDSQQAVRLLTQGFDLLGDLGYLVYHTASSTKDAPRLRIMVNAEAIPVARYRAAVQAIAAMLGLAEPTHESLVAVQIMYLPVLFKGETEGPVIALKSEGDPFVSADAISSSGEVPDIEVADLDFLRPPMEGVTLEDAEQALGHIDPDCAMQSWIEVAMGLKHQFGEDGYALWDAWSAKGEKYDGADKTAKRWNTFSLNTTNRAPITIRSLFKLAADAGWKNDVIARRARQELTEWITNKARSTEELLDTAAKKIAKASPIIGRLERTALISTLRTTLAEREIAVTSPDLRKEVHRLEVEATKTAGFPPWSKGICYITSTGKFYRYLTGRMMTPETVDLIYGTETDADAKSLRAREYLIRVVQVQQVEALRYDPRQGDKRFYTDDQVPYCNTYRATYPKGDPARAKEAGDLFLKHIRNLIAEEEYVRWFIDYLAFLVQKPGVKIRWSMLLQSTKGAGKTFIAVVLGAVLGRANVSKLAGSDVIERQYNDWAYGHQVVVMEEVRVVGHNRHAVMDKLKPCISDDEISINCKFEPLRTVPNITNYLIFTNHQDALAIQDDERRYFVIRSPLQRAEQVAALGGERYFRPLFEMVRDNAAGLRAWFEAWEISDKFDPEGRAPETPYQHEMASNSATPLAAVIRLILEEEDHPMVRHDLVSAAVLRTMLSEYNGLGDYSDQLIASILRELGWVKVGRTMIAGSRHYIWSKGYAGADPIAAMHERAELL